jgi:hypothetical protein
VADGIFRVEEVMGIPVGIDVAALRADQPPRSMDAPPPMVSCVARSGE